MHVTLSICKQSGSIAGQFCSADDIEQKTYVLLRPGNQFYDLDDKVLDKLFEDSWVRTDRSIAQYIAEFPVCTIDSSFDEGLEKVCESAEWMLGGIDVDYYYAVTMTSLKDLVDLCGGLDYDLGFDYHIQGRNYKKGLQHIDGQGFLDYCRVRKAENGIPAKEQGDVNRVNRQKRMLVAMFKQMKADKLITKIPEISSKNGKNF